MSELHAIFREVAGGGWQSYSRPTSVYVAGDTLADIRREFTEAVALLREDDNPDLVVHEHVERAVAPGIFVRTALDDNSASRELTAAVMRSAVEVPGSMRLIRGRALTAATGDMVFVCCQPTDRIRWVSRQLGRVDAVQVCAPAGDGAIWWMPLASPASDVPADEAETLEAAGLGGEDARVGELPAAAQRYREHAEQARKEVAAAFAAPLGTELLPTFVAAAA